ncbi:MAG: hypothetical protein CFE30_25505 [Bradyrhizobium sp. PARBB1]|nr:MAG: hypothetical protein CFE30_25505 [Bradyrhizobium sp. PARBB1]PSO19887.1 hypothetical protein C7G43_29550 [Bradyrhizobium sp. MOS004]HAQ81443.1 hypothetical protein [Bradyrhizobium sp.]HAR14871.1 hypothetical protein [Bradyrhizobium sp.]HAR27383.1 hypothetical protein [Bradyrhizobium sp.]
MSSFGLSTELQSLAQLSDAFYALKQLKWPLFGSDLLVLLQALSDSTWSLSLKQLEILVPIAGVWRLKTIVSRLIVLRSVNNFSGESEYFKRHSDEVLIESKLPNHLKAYIARGLSDGDFFRRAKRYITDPIEGSIVFSLQFYSYLERQEFNKLLILVRDQYERDPASLAFINWDMFHELAPVGWGQQYLLNILLSVILLSPQIISRFESVEFSYGEGFVTNQLINYVNYLKSHNQGLAQFARSISNMREKARGVVAAFVLQKSVIEVYAYAFRDKPVGSKLNIPMADLEVCHARMRLAYLFRESETLPADYCDRIIAEESAFRKMYRFQAVFRSSRIRIDWKYLEMEIADTIDADFGFLFRTIRVVGAPATGSTADIMATIIAQRVCELTLFESATSLERALSNNLRHGVVIPRFLKVFTDAISNQTSSKPLSGQTNRAWYEATFALGGSRLFKLEDEIISLIGDYQEEWLKVNRDGRFYQELVQAVATLIIKHIAKGHNFRFDDLVGQLIELQKRAISDILGASRNHLVGEIRPLIEKLVGVANVDIRPLNDIGSSEFLDSLTINLHNAFNQVSGWISLVDFEESRLIEFEIGDLIDEESNTFIISDRSKARIKFECVDRRSNRPIRIKDIKVSGRAFELFDQIIHNGLSNARKRSVLRNDTEILIRVTRDVSDLTIWIGNNFAKGQLGAMRKHQARAKKIVTRATRPRKSKGKRRVNSYKEGGYGFLKVIDACERLLKVPPVFNFPIISAEDGQFIVEIKLPGAEALLV